ncbi:MAG: class I tRNA ligase family protein [candidate division Zixibacteria bacterium]|nr:class I tRNA ligase family protein [candidate division Zixibacteria bacterium]
MTASEIIFLWVARMVMSGYEFMGEAPFTDVYIHGTVRDERGIKMSKSLGNGIDPLEITNQYGADSLRISMTLATPDGQDPCIGRNTFETGRNFVNKLYQVSRFVMMRLAGRPPVLDTIDRNDLVIFDRWILSRLTQTITEVDQAMAEYRLSAASKILYNFVWEDYCSWYVELIKPDQPGAVIREGSLNVATYVLDKIIKLLHPFVPFVTEEIYLQLTAGAAETITFGPWPKADPSLIDAELEANLRQIQDVVMAVRSIRSELNVPPGKKSDLHVRVNDPALGELLRNHVGYFRSLARVENLVCGTDVKKPPMSASAVLSGAEIFVPLAGLIDLDLEKSRLQKELNNLRDALEKLGRKLANPDFLANAPEDVVAKERAKKEDYESRIGKLNRNLEQIMGW